MKPDLNSPLFKTAQWAAIQEISRLADMSDEDFSFAELHDLATLAAHGVSANRGGWCWQDSANDIHGPFQSITRAAKEGASLLWSELSIG